MAVRIPRVFHQVWIGDRPVPERDQIWAASWRRHNPGWEMILWADHPSIHRSGPWTTVRQIPSLINQWAARNIERLVGSRARVAAQSDIARYEIVARCGGVYLDTDVECFQCVEPLLENVVLFCADEFGPCCGNYCFGAVANHPAMWTVVRELGPFIRKQIELSEKGERVPGILELTGPFYLNGKIRTHPDCVLFPSLLFNPLWARHDGSLVESWPTVSVANHHYAGSWYDQVKTAPDDHFRALDGVRVVSGSVKG